MTNQKKFVDVLRSFIFKYTFSAILIVFVMAMLIYAMLHLRVSKSLLIKFESELIGQVQGEILNVAINIEDNLATVKEHTELLKEGYERLFLNYDDYTEKVEKSIFTYHENGAYYKPVNNGGSSLYYSAKTPITEYAIEKAIKTEWLDPIMSYIVETDDFVIQSYFNSFDNMNRLYPYIEMIPEVFGPAINMSEFEFYFLADGYYNPERKIVWASPHFDPAGAGWIISCIAPVYNGDFLEGVVGLDTTISQIESISISIPSLTETILLLIDDTGLIISMNNQANLLLGLHSKVGVEGYIGENSGLINIIDDELRLSLLAGMKQNLKSIVYKDQKYYLQKQAIKETDWQLISLTNEAYISDKIKDINKNVVMNMIIVFVTILIIFSIVALVFKKKIDSVASLFSTPLESMALNAKHFGVDGKTIKRMKSTGIEEIDMLNRELHLMSKEILSRSQKLVQAQIKNRRAELTIVAYHKEAITDELTQLFNRRKIDEVISSEVTRARRYRSKFSVILLDIDYFKDVNDQYGHQIGDDILIGVAKTLKSSVRDSDVVSRWGGDEFLIVAIEASEEEAFNLGEKIRRAVFEATHVKKIKVTTSIGVAEFNIAKDDARDILRKADIALYEAKNVGKNKVSRYSEIGDENES